MIPMFIEMMHSSLKWFLDRRESDSLKLMLKWRRWAIWHFSKVSEIVSEKANRWTIWHVCKFPEIVSHI